MKLIVATSNTKFGKSFKENIQSKYDVEVVEIVTSEEDLLQSLLDNPDVEGVILKTDLAKKNGDNQLELLSDVVFNIRKHPKFEHVIFTILTDYSAGHPLLAEFFDMGVYNIFSLTGKGFTLKNVIDSIKNPMTFSMALNYRNVDPDIPWRKDLTKKTTLHVKFDEASQDVSKGSSDNKVQNLINKTSNLKINYLKSKKQVTTEKTEEVEHEETKDEKLEDSKVEEFDAEWLFADFENTKKSKNPLVIGTVIIAVTSVQEHLGSTHTAISIATHLHKKGYDVALVEANTSMDFDRIHSLIEGERIILDDVKFNYCGFDHIKYRENMDLGEIYTKYQYVVLDMGDITESPYKEEFRRSHIKCVVATADEWKYYLLQEFLMKYDEPDLVFLVPCSNKKSTNDLASRLKYYDVYPLEKHSIPYKVPGESAEVYEQILKKFEVSQNRISNKKQMVLTGIIAAMVTAIIFLTVFMYFN